MKKAYPVTYGNDARRGKRVLHSFLPVLIILFPLTSFTQNTPHYRDSLLRQLNSHTNDTALVNLYNKLGASYASAGSDTALIYSNNAMALSGQLRYKKGLAEAFTNLGRHYRGKGDFARALQQALQRLELYQQLGDGTMQGNTYLDIAQIYKDMVGQSSDESSINVGIDYAEKAYEVFGSVSDTAGMVMSLNMQGILNRDMAKRKGKEHLYDTALVLYNKAFDFIKRSGKGEVYTGKLYNNISQVYIEHKKDYRRALQYLFKAVEFNKAGHYTPSLSYNYGNISNAYLLLGDYNNSLRYARLMHAATVQQNEPLRIQNAYQSLYKTFREMGQMDSALHYFIVADALDDSLTNVAKSRQVMDLQVRYETAQKQSEIDVLSARSIAQRRRLVTLFVIATLIACTAGVMIWLYRRVSKQKQQLALQSHRLELVMKELHHRVKNNLQIVSSLLSLQTYKLHEAESINILKESQQRVQAMSLIHQRLYTKDMLTAINMQEYITDLVESLLTSYGYSPQEVDLSITVEKQMLDVEKALPIGLLVNEMVTNAFKYAFAGVERPALSIALTARQGGLTLVVKDNGAGLDLAAWHGKGTSFGKQLIQLLGKQLKARETVTVHHGTEFTLEIPLAAA